MYPSIGCGPLNMLSKTLLALAKTALFAGKTTGTASADVRIEKKTSIWWNSVSNALRCKRAYRWCFIDVYLCDRVTKIVVELFKCVWLGEWCKWRERASTECMTIWQILFIWQTNMNVVAERAVKRHGSVSTRDNMNCEPTNGTRPVQLNTKISSMEKSCKFQWKKSSKNE